MRPLEVTITGASNRQHEEMDNLRSAFGWSIEAGDIGRALELACSLQLLWLSRGRIQEGLAWFEAVFTEGEPPTVSHPTCAPERSPIGPCSTPGWPITT